ncbi:MAG: DUF3179 domain-containing protein [Pirellulales bacterium]|nr:DUF3179 domain-containing protein [Pirellulales bacterium]
MSKKIGLLLFIVAIIAFDIHVAAKYMAASRQAAEADVRSPLNEDPSTDPDFVEFDEFSVPYDSKIAKANDNHKLLRYMYDVPGITTPRLFTAQEAQLKDSAPVVGVEVKGLACAFSLNAMRSEDSHIVNLVMQETPISVSYCPLAGCVRVLTGEGSSPIPLRLGGLNEEDELVFLLRGTLYDQSSRTIPLVDYQFSTSTFGEWRKEHPGTKVYVQRSRKSSSSTSS